MNPVTENRIGKVKIHRSFYLSSPADVWGKIFQGARWIKIEPLLQNDLIDCLLFHPNFRLVKPGTEPPFYNCEMENVITGKFTFAWHEVHQFYGLDRHPGKVYLDMELKVDNG